MTKSSTTWIKSLAFACWQLYFALVFTSIILWVTKTSPIDAYSNILRGALGSFKGVSNVLVAWVPLLLATAGLLIYLFDRFVEYWHRGSDHDGRHLCHRHAENAA